MAQKLEVPKFASESEEARWWFENQDAVADEFELAEREDRLGHGRALSRALAASTTIALDLEDAALAKAQAERRGLKYEAYVRMIVHKALLTEEHVAV